MLATRPAKKSCCSCTVCKDPTLRNHINITSSLCIVFDSIVADYGLEKYFPGWIGVGVYAAPTALSFVSPFITNRVIPFTYSAISRCIKKCFGKKEEAPAQSYVELHDDEEDLCVEMDHVAGAVLEVAEAKNLVDDAEKPAAHRRSVSLPLAKSEEINEGVDQKTRHEIAKRKLQFVKKIVKAVNDYHEQESLGGWNFLSNAFYLGVRILRAALIVLRMYDLASDDTNDKINTNSNYAYNLISNAYMVALILRPTIMHLHAQYKKRNKTPKETRAAAEVPVEEVEISIADKATRVTDVPSTLYSKEKSQKAIELADRKQADLKQTRLPASPIAVAS